MLECTGPGMDRESAIEFFELMADCIPEEIRDEEFCGEYEKALNTFRGCVLEIQQRDTVAGGWRNLLLGLNPKVIENQEQNTVNLYKDNLISQNKAPSCTLENMRQCQALRISYIKGVNSMARWAENHPECNLEELPLVKAIREDLEAARQEIAELRRRGPVKEMPWHPEFYKDGRHPWPPEQTEEKGVNHGKGNL